MRSLVFARLLGSQFDYAMKTSAILLIPILILSGCASGQLKPLPKADSNVGVGEVAVIRTSNIAAMSVAYTLQLNGEDAVAVRNGQYTVLELTAGSYSLGVKTHGGLTPTTKIDRLQIDVLAGKRVYYLISPHFSKTAEIEPISAEEGEMRIQESDRILLSYE